MKRKFLAAIVLAAIFRADKLSVREVCNAVWSIGRALTARRGKASARLAKARLEHCEGCPIFYSPLRTCGSPLVEGHEDLGCWCQMDVKAQDIKATCWANEFTDMHIGWPKELEVSNR